VLAVALRAVAMLGYPPAKFFSDSFSYLGDAVAGQPDPVRGNGYAFFLRVLMPLHSFNVVTGIQALMGLAMGVLIYAVLRRRGLPWWGATLCALPVLFDVYELQLEHMISSDVLFFAMVTVPVVLLVWWDKPPWPALVAAGLLIGASAAVRNVGEVLLVFIVIGLIARRVGWRRIVATAVAGLVPIAAYMVWFHAGTGQYALNDGGPFLYARVQAFAECSKMNPPPDLRPLCDPRPPAQREISQEYAWSANSPLVKLSGGNNNAQFTPQRSKLATSFAERAIESQPLSYARVVGQDVWTTFDWNRPTTNNGLMGLGSAFEFYKTVPPLLSWLDSAQLRAARELGGASYGEPKVVQPWARFLWAYDNVYLPGPALLVIIGIGLAGIVAGMRRRAWRERRWGGLALLPWLVGVGLIVLPDMTAGYSNRYVLAGVPAVCLAAGLAVAGHRLKIRKTGSG
jgi:hypothetical protein